MRVLIVEDEKALANAIARGFRKQAIAVDIAYDGTDAYQKATSTAYDVIVLDRDLPGMSGDELCRRISTSGSLTRVIMLSASAAVDERIVGLSLGADDYLSKPFAFEELVARVRALYRRSSPPAPPILTRADIQLDPGKRTVHRGDRKIALTRKEFGILEVLMMAEGATVSSKELLDRVWDATANPDTNIVRVTMMHLRLKLGDPAVIRTAIGIGYQL